MHQTMFKIKISFKLFIALALIIAMNAKAFAKTYIVCVGISDYPGERNDLMNCSRDAETIKWLFETNGKAEVAIVKDKNATKASITRLMRNLYAKAGYDDTIVLFYSGHGNGGCLECYDAQLSYETIWSLFSISSAKYRVAFIDACYSGTIRKKYDNSKLAKKKVMFFSSTRSGEKSLEDPFMKNGIFTAYLQQGLRGSADVNRDKTITAKELFDYVSKKVREKTNDAQHPTMWGRFDDNMPIITW